MDRTTGKKLIWKVVRLGIRLYFHISSRVAYYFFYQFRQAVTRIPFLKENAMYSVSETLAIYAIYQPKALSPLIKRSIRHLHENKIKIMIIAPHHLNTHDLEFLTKNSCIILMRYNFGRDFASYKYAILYLLNNPELIAPIKKILLLNDSIIFPIQEKNSILEKILNYNHDVVGLIENYEYNWHIGSYFILFKKDFLLSAEMEKFWIKYKPYSSRFHAILKGEIALGQKIKTLTNAYTIIYNSELFLNFLKKSLYLQTKEIDPFKQFISTHFRTELSENPLFLELPHSLDKIKIKFETSSAIHHFSLALIKYVDCFFMKRDICYRGLFSVEDVMQLIQSVNTDSQLLEAVHFDLNNKESIKSMPLLKKILVAAGAI